jgi:hypothetical protein
MPAIRLKRGAFHGEWSDLTLPHKGYVASVVVLRFLGRVQLVTEDQAVRFGSRAVVAAVPTADVETTLPVLRVAG